MTGEMEGQLTFADLGIWSGRMSQEPSPPTRGKTSGQSSRRSSASSARTAPMCLCLTRGGGKTQDASMMSWADGLLLGAYTPQSFGARPREENVCALSQILEDLPHQRYCLSGKACIGILRRVEKKKKVLPDLLWKALKEQAMEDS